MKTPLAVGIGFAADDAGGGVAYARVGDARTFRIPFSVRRLPALSGREVGYAALRAVACALGKRGVDSVNFLIEDPQLIADLRERREVPQALTLAYVSLRCALNQLRHCSVTESDGAHCDLSARARSDVAMHAAA